MKNDQNNHSGDLSLADGTCWRSLLVWRSRGKPLLTPQETWASDWNLIPHDMFPIAARHNLPEPQDDVTHFSISIIMQPEICVPPGTATHESHISAPPCENGMFLLTSIAAIEQRCVFLGRTGIALNTTEITEEIAGRGSVNLETDFDLASRSGNL